MREDISHRKVMFALMNLFKRFHLTYETFLYSVFSTYELEREYSEVERESLLTH